MVTSQNIHNELTALFNAGLDGDSLSYSRFLKLIAPILRRYVAKKLAFADSEDVVQEILISVHKARHTYDGKRPLMPWLIAIANFRINDHLRKVYATLRNEVVNIDDFAETLADVTNTDSDNEYINMLFENTSQREKEILTLMHVEGYTAKETGNRLGMKESAVKVAAHRAIKKIREKIGK